MAISVSWNSGDSFVVDVRAHFLTIDQPYAEGGRDLGPTPVELFVASLGACVGFYAERFLKRHDLPVDGLRVDCAFEMADKPAKVARIDVKLTLPGGFPESRRSALASVVEHCTVHNSLRAPPDVRIELEHGARVP